VDRREKGEAVDLDTLNELLLVHKLFDSQELTEQEYRTVSFFLKRKRGESLTDKELESIALLNLERKKEETEIGDLRDAHQRKERGEPFADNRWYELNLFAKTRTGERLDRDEIIEVKYFRLRRQRALREEEENELEALKVATGTLLTKTNYLNSEYLSGAGTGKKYRKMTLTILLS